MNDQNHNEREEAAVSGVAAPQSKEPGEFTRHFFGGNAPSGPAQVTPGPSVPDLITDARPAQPAASNPAAQPGEFTKMFSGSGKASGGNNSRSESGPPQTERNDDFTNHFGGSNVQLTDDPIPGGRNKSEPVPRPSVNAVPDARPSSFPPSALDFPGELKSPAKAAETPRHQKSLAEAFRHPLAPNDSLDLSPAGRPRDDESGNSDSPSGFTKLFSEAPTPPKKRPAPSTSIDFPEPQPRNGPSDYTRVVSERGKSAPGAAPTSVPAATPSPGFQIASPALPSIPSPVMPSMPAAYPPQVQVQYIPATPPAMPSLPQTPSIPSAQVTMPSAQTQPGAKWVAYLPVLIVINVLFMVAVLVVLYFALRK